MRLNDAFIVNIEQLYDKMWDASERYRPKKRCDFIVDNTRYWVRKHIGIYSNYRVTDLVNYETGKTVPFESFEIDYGPGSNNKELTDFQIKLGKAVSRYFGDAGGFLVKDWNSDRQLFDHALTLFQRNPKDEDGKVIKREYKTQELLCASGSEVKTVLSSLLEKGWKVISKNNVSHEYSLVNQGKIIKVNHYGDIIGY